MIGKSFEVMIGYWVPQDRKKLQTEVGMASGTVKSDQHGFVKCPYCESQKIRTGGYDLEQDPISLCSEGIKLLAWLLCMDCSKQWVFEVIIGGNKDKVVVDWWPEDIAQEWLDHLEIEMDRADPEHNRETLVERSRRLNAERGTKVPF